MNNTKVLIAIAAYKEAENIKNLISEIKLHSPSSTILIINDNSNDGTREIIE